MKKQSKTEKIREMLKDHYTPAVIAKKMKVSKSYVYTVRSKMKAKAKKPVTLRDVVAAAHAEGTGVQVEIVPNDPLEVQVGGDHYKGMKIQPIEFILANELGFLEGCIVKRISRWKLKGGREDLEKIKHEVDLLLRSI